MQLNVAKMQAKLKYEMEKVAQAEKIEELERKLRRKKRELEERDARDKLFILEKKIKVLNQFDTLKEQRSQGTSTALQPLQIPVDSSESQRMETPPSLPRSLVITEAFYTKLHTWQKIHSKDYKGLRRLADFLQQCKVAMEENWELAILNQSQEIRGVLMNLPEWIRNHWRHIEMKTRTTSGKYPPFADFADFLDEEASIVCDHNISLTVPQCVSRDDVKPNHKRFDSTEPTYRELTFESPNLYKQNTGKPYKCTVCGRRYTTEEAFSVHMCARRKPDSYGKMGYTVDQWDKVSSQPKDLHDYYNDCHAPAPLYEKILKCEQSTEMSMSQDILDMHVEREHRERKPKFAKTECMPDMEIFKKNGKEGTCGNKQMQQSVDEIPIIENVQELQVMESASTSDIPNQENALACPHCIQENFETLELLEVHMKMVHPANATIEIISDVEILQESGKSQEACGNMRIQKSAAEIPVTENEQELQMEASPMSDTHQENALASPRCLKDSFETLELLDVHMQLVHDAKAIIENDLDVEIFQESGESQKEACGNKQVQKSADNVSTKNGQKLEMLKPSFKPDIQNQKKFTTEAQLSLHYLYCSPEYGCASCPKTFFKPDELLRHIMDIDDPHLPCCLPKIFDSKD